MHLKTAAISLLSVLLSNLIFIGLVQAEPTSEITKKKVLRYIEKSREQIIEYQCVTKDVAGCNVVCSSGGNDYIKAEDASKAFHAERRSSINGSITGYYLVVDVNEGAGKKDVWATLQVESSCTFVGMEPTL